RGAETKDISARYNIGWLNTQEPQFLPLMDFLWRNDCDMRSADEDLALWRRDHAERAAELERTLGAELFVPGCHWTYFSLNDARATLTFPTQMAEAGLIGQPRRARRTVVPRVLSRLSR